MKDIGFTQDGGRLVEMNQGEYDQFVKLHMAVEGRGFPSLERSGYVFEVGFDFSTTFEVIRAFYTSEFHINQFQQLLDGMKSALKQKG